MNALTRKIGPLPAWAWALLATGAILVVVRYRHHSAASATVQDVVTGADAGSPNAATDASIGVPAVAPTGSSAEYGNLGYDPRFDELNVIAGELPTIEGQLEGIQRTGAADLLLDTAQSHPATPAATPARSRGPKASTAARKPVARKPVRRPAARKPVVRRRKR